MVSQKEIRDELKERILDLDNGKFDNFSKILIQEVEGTSDTELTPFPQGGDLDLTGELGNSLIRIRFGSQIRHYSGNISGPTIQSFVSSLQEYNCHAGCFITSSDFQKEALRNAQEAELPVELISIDNIIDVMVENEIGIKSKSTPEEFVIDEGFWDIFDETIGDGLIPSNEIPQANKIPYLNTVLFAINDGYRFTPEIKRYMESNTGKSSWDERQADYYATAGWCLNYVHRDTDGEFEGRKRQKWGLTRDGQEYIKLLEQGRREEAEAHLIEHIREIEIVRRLLKAIKARSEVTNEEFKDLFFNEVALNRSTSDRRAGTIGQWLQMLPEINRKKKDGIRYEFLSESERLM